MSLSLSTAETSFNFSNFFFIFPPKPLENLVCTTFFKPHSLKLCIWLSPPLHLTAELQSPQHQSQLHIWSFQIYLCKLPPLWIHLSPCLQLFCTVHCSLIISQTILPTSVLKKRSCVPRFCIPTTALVLLCILPGYLIHFPSFIHSTQNWICFPLAQTFLTGSTGLHPCIYFRFLKINIFISFKKTAFLINNSPTTEPTHLECIIQWTGVYSQSCTSTTTIQVQNTDHPQSNPIPVSSHSPFLVPVLGNH